MTTHFKTVFDNTIEPVGRSSFPVPQNGSIPVSTKALIGSEAVSRSACPAHTGQLVERLPLETRKALGDVAVEPVRLLRRVEAQLKLKISRSTFYARLDPASRYFDPSMPRPFTFPGSRMPVWNEAALDAYIAKYAQAALPPEALGHVATGSAVKGRAK